VTQQVEQPTAPGSASQPVAKSRFKKLAWLESIATPFVFAVILGPVYGAWLGGGFWDANGRVFDFYSSAPTLIIALGITFCLLAGHFDLSVASLSGLVAVLTVGLRVKQGMPFVLVLVLMLLLGAGAGLINGLVVSRLRINAFIVTLATGGMVAGLATAYTGGTSIVALSGKTPVPNWFSGTTSVSSFTRKAPMGVVIIVVVLATIECLTIVLERTNGRPGRIRAGASILVGLGGAVLGYELYGNAGYVEMVVLLLATVVWATLRYTIFGRAVIASGANATAARLAGVRVDGAVTMSFVLSGLFAAVSGLVVAGSLGSVQAGLSDSLLVPSYAAVFLSTVLFSSGRFHPWGTILGGFAIVEISQGLVIGGVHFTWVGFFNGLALFIAVTVSTFVRRGRQWKRN
jgi:ribose/xylose/arabinose/galactoside ABC-type transport system permease subunit